MATRRTVGGILWLLDIGERREPQLIADFRRQYGISFYDVGHSVSYREGFFLVGMLLQNPESWVHALEQGWEHPVTAEWIVLKHTFDLLVKVNSDKPQPEYPAPWIRSTRPKSQDRSEVLRKLKLMNPERRD